MSITKVNKIFAINMRLRRKQLGISQEKLAELAGLHRTYIGGIEQFLRNPSVKSMEKIAKALNTSVSLLTNVNFQEIMSSDYSVCQNIDGDFKFSAIDADEMDPKHLEMLDEICNS